MKVLLSAYSCLPGRGSEPGVGWNWAIEIARLGHEVWVLTHVHNREAIEAELATSPPIKNLNFLYYGPPPWLGWLNKGNYKIYLYYSLWQWGAYRLAKKEHALLGFDRVQHITYGSLRQASFMGRLGIPFVFGPVGGGERAPYRLRRGYSFRGWVLDFVRDISNQMVPLTPTVRGTFRRAEQILVKTPQSGALVPTRYLPKVRCQLEIGIHPTMEDTTESVAKKDEQGFRILYIGRFIYWKGMYLGLPAFARMLEACPSASLTMVGKGPDEARWRSLAKSENIDSQVSWISWLPQAEVSVVYDQHDVLLFPSLHDSSGNVVLEAMAHGLPVVCLDLGGPGQIVDEGSGIVVETGAAKSDAVIADLADALSRLSGDAALHRHLSKGARRRAGTFTWPAAVGSLYEPADQCR